MKSENIQLNALREIGDLSNEGLIIYNLLQQEFFYINANASSLVIEASVNSHIDFQSLLRIVIPEDRRYLKMRYKKFKDNSVCVDVEIRLKRKNGTLTYVCCNAYLILNKAFLVVFVRDVSKPKQHEDYLIEFSTKKNTLLDTLTHNLSGALSLTQNLIAQAGKSIDNFNREDLKVYLNLVNENNIHCIQIIDELLDNENIKSTEIFVKNSRFDIVEKIGFIYQKLSDTYHIKKFVFESPSSAIYVNTDDVKLLLIVNNLVSNAVKFTDDNGIITIKIEDLGVRIRISISDNGIGVPEKLQPYLFDRKGISGRAGLKGEKSIGLGLSICKKLAILIGSAIFVESIEGEGSSFYFSISKE